MDLNHRAFYSSDLQSDAINHSATTPYLVDDVRFEPTKPQGTWVTAKHNTPTLSIIQYYLNTLSATFQSMPAQCVY